MLTSHFVKYLILAFLYLNLIPYETDLHCNNPFYVIFDNSSLRISYSAGRPSLMRQTYIDVFL